VASNIPGPQAPPFLHGGQGVGSFPPIPPGGKGALSVGGVTLAGVMGFGFTADWRSFPDLAVLALFVGEAFDQLKKAAGI